MGENRAADQHLVVVKDQPVDFDGDRAGQQSAGKFRHFFGGNDADFGERFRQVPAVVKDAGLSAHPIYHWTPQQLSELRLIHQRMGAQGHQVIAGRRSPADFFL